MKSSCVKLLILTVSLCCGQHVVAQVAASDSLFFADGSVAVVNVSKNSPEQIECTYPGETMLSVINKSDLKRIVYRSGRVEIFEANVQQEKRSAVDNVSVKKDRNHIAISASGLFPGLINGESAPAYNAEVCVMYVRDVGKIFHFCVGGGIGLSNPVVENDEWEDYNRSDVFQIPVFIRGKFDFWTKPSHMFAAVKIGTRICSVYSEEVDENFFPYMAYGHISIGYDLKLNSGRLGAEIIVSGMEICKSYRLSRDLGDTWEVNPCQLVGLAVTFEW